MGERRPAEGMSVMRRISAPLLAAVCLVAVPPGLLAQATTVTCSSKGTEREFCPADTSKGVIIIAATNTPEVLDSALMRAGRFDRQIIVDRPDLEGRESILKIHVGKIKLSPDVDLKTIAARTPGMAGADLANIVNEAALLAVRRGASLVQMPDLEEAIDRIMLDSAP